MTGEINLLYVDVPASDEQFLLKVQFASVDRSVQTDLGLNLVSTGATNTIGSIGTGQFPSANVTLPPNQPPTLNVYRATGYDRSLPNHGVTLDALIKRGMRLAVCQMSTRGYAAAIAQSTGSKTDDVYQELTEHLVPNSHLVPAGIVAVNRAQERGYSFGYVG